MSKISESQMDEAHNHCFNFINASPYDKRKGRHLRKAIELVGETKAKRMVKDARQTQAMLGLT